MGLIFDLKGLNSLFVNNVLRVKCFVLLEWLWLLMRFIICWLLGEGHRCQPGHLSVGF